MRYADPAAQDEIDRLNEIISSYTDGSDALREGLRAELVATRDEVRRLRIQASVAASAAAWATEILQRMSLDAPR